MEKNIHQQVEETINSFDGMQRAEALPFFQTRARAALDKHLQQEPLWLPVRRPAWVIASLGLFLVINTALILQISRQPKATGVSETPTLQSFASEFGLSNSSNY